MPRISRILVPTDFSSGSKEALEHGLAMAKSFGANVDVLHTWALPSQVEILELQSEGRWSSKSLEESVRNDIQTMMTGFVKNVVAPDGVELKTRIESGDPVDAINEAAKDYDLVVLSTHGRTGLSRMMLGSVATKILRSCPVPVMTVRMSAESVTAEKEANRIERHPEEHTLLALFNSSAEIGDAYRGLIAEGISMDDVSLIMTEESYKTFTPVADRTHAKEGAGAGSLMGGAIGGVVGLLMVLGAAVTAGAALLVIGPAVALAAAGGLIGGLVGFGVPSDIAQRVHREVEENGRSLMALHYMDDKNLGIARRVIEKHDGDIVTEG